MSKRNRIIYWVATLWLALGMTATGIQQLLHLPLEGALAPPGVYGITQLGYPVHFLTLIGIWKLLGVVALLIPRFPLLKEWAYAGFFFLTTGAVFAHLAVGHAAAELLPALLLLVLTLLSWYFRPADRKVAPARP
ncbi:MAG: DoxX family protein [Bacteroidetes bacterium]|nr:DoxX family protein [Bacteroidota bacterium]